jgi:hypothetical protein
VLFNHNLSLYEIEECIETEMSKFQPI